MEPDSAHALTIVCTDYFYSWACGHHEQLPSDECVSADEPRPHTHIHTRQDLGDPGYGCPTCPAPAAPAPVFYAAAGPHAHGAWARLAALQMRLDALWRRHTQTVPGALHTRHLWIPPRSSLETRVEVARLARILEARGL